MLAGTPNQVTTLGTVTSLMTGFHFADIHLSNNLQILNVKVQEDNTGAPNRCHENCRKTGVNPNDQCLTDGMQAAGCAAANCITGASANGTMTCYVTPTTAVGLGGLHLDFTKVGNYTTTN
jgi:hypothetical protein